MREGMKKMITVKEGWALKNWCFSTVVLEKTLESSLDNKEIKQVYPKGNQPWIFIGRIDAEAEAPMFWPSDEEPAHWERPWCWEKGEEGQQRMRWLDSITDSTDMNLSRLREIVRGRGDCCAAVHGVAKSQTWLSDQTTAAICYWPCLDSWRECFWLLKSGWIFKNFPLFCTFHSMLEDQATILPFPTPQPSSFPFSFGFCANDKGAPRRRTVQAKLLCCPAWAAVEGGHLH